MTKTIVDACHETLLSPQYILELDQKREISEIKSKNQRSIDQEAAWRSIC
jgi:hypothetical protein